MGPMPGIDSSRAAFSSSRSCVARSQLNILNQLVKVTVVSMQAVDELGYLFTNRRASRLKVLVHDGIGIWLAARRLNQGQFVWPHIGSEPKQLALTHEQLAGLVLGLPWQRIREGGVIRIV